MKFERYSAVSNDLAPSKFIIAKCVEVEEFEGLDIGDLWKIHNKVLKNIDFDNFEFNDLEFVKPNLLDLKIEIAKKIFKYCHFCEHRC